MRLCMKRWSVVIAQPSWRTLLLLVTCHVHGPSRLCMCYKSLALLCYGSQHWSAAAAGSQTSPGTAGGRWSVCSGWSAASWAAEALAEHLLLTVPTSHQHINHGITFTWICHIHSAFRSEMGFLFLWRSKSDLLGLLWRINNWESPSSERNVWNKVWNIFQYIPVCDLFVKFPDIHRCPKKIYHGTPEVLES